MNNLKNQEGVNKIKTKIFQLLGMYSIVVILISFWGIWSVPGTITQNLLGIGLFIPVLIYIVWTLIRK